MPTTSQDRRKSELLGAKRKRELFKEEDVKLQWTTVRKAVSSCPPRIAAILSHALSKHATKSYMTAQRQKSVMFKLCSKDTHCSNGEPFPLYT